VGALGGQNHGANARDAFIFEHLEIALLELLERLATRAGDPETAAVAHACLLDDQAMAAKITRNWDNVLSLTLASKQIAFERPPA
jgi:ferritin-like metal-binding protein YciE